MRALLEFASFGKGLSVPRTVVAAWTSGVGGRATISVLQAWWSAARLRLPDCLTLGTGDAWLALLFAALLTPPSLLLVPDSG